MQEVLVGKRSAPWQIYVVILYPNNVTNHPAATKDCPFVNARLCRSGALDRYPVRGMRCDLFFTGCRLGIGTLLLQISKELPRLISNIGLWVKGNQFVEYLYCLF